MDATNTKILDQWFRSVKANKKLIDIKFCPSNTDTASLESFSADINKLRNAIATGRTTVISKI